MKIAAIIPARYDSTRFPGKPLAEIDGKPMIEHVYARVKKAKNVDKVLVATDDNRIKKAVKDFGGNVEMTSSKHKSGTDRVAEVARELEVDIIVNVQGDEPLIEPVMIDQAIKPFQNDKNIVMSTLKKKIDNLNEINNPNVVKVITDRNNYALYFSRSTIPYKREDSNFDVEYYKHIGLYVYKKDFLLKYSEMETTFLEKTESLEQLRVLENGYKIKVVETAFDTVGVDTPEDFEYVKELIHREKTDLRWE